MTAVETLQKAARLMRERATAAMCPCGGPVCTAEKWFHRDELEARFDGSDRTIDHIEALTPAVALAVADLLEEMAAVGEVSKNWDPPLAAMCLAVARTYLRSES